MNCEKAHMYLLKKKNQALCPFCDEQLEETKCGNKMLWPCKYNCRRFQTICGSVHGYKSANEFVDFYENIHRIRKKFVYHRKYILTVIKDIAQKNNIHVGYYNREKILRIFTLIDQASKQVDTDRKGMLSINFILKQLVDILGMEYKYIPLTKSGKTLNYCNLW